MKKMFRYLFILMQIVLLSTTHCFAKKSGVQKCLKLKINYLQAKLNDTLILKISQTYIGGVPLGEPLAYYSTKNSEGQYKFNIASESSCGYFEILVKRAFNGMKGETMLMPLLNLQFWEEGDSLEIQIAHKTKFAGNYSVCSFVGRGAAKYRARYNIGKLVMPTIVDDNFDGNIKAASNYRKLTRNERSRLSRLNNSTYTMSSLSRSVLKADILFSGRADRFYFIKEYFKNRKENSSFKRGFIDAFNQLWVGDNQIGISAQELKHSSEYLRYAFEKAKCDVFLKQELNDAPDVLAVLNKHYSGAIRDALIVHLLSSERLPANSRDLYNRAKLAVKGKPYIKMLDKLSGLINGNLFGDYTLTDVNGLRVKITDFANKIILLDFWSTGCGYCSIYYKKVLVKIQEKFANDSNVVFMSINVDRNRQTWKNSINSKLYTDENSVNLYTEGLGVTHPITLENGINRYPLVILLDKKRIIRYYNSDNLYNIESLEDAINELKGNS